MALIFIPKLFAKIVCFTFSQDKPLPIGNERMIESPSVFDDFLVKISGIKKIDSNYKAWKHDGLATEWHESGDKKIEVNYRGGQADELATEWSDSDKEILSAALHKWTDLEHGESFAYHYSLFRNK